MPTILPQQFSDQDVEILEQETAYQGYFRIDRYQLRHRLFAGGWSKSLPRELFERGHAAAAILYDPHRDQVVLIEQFRIGALRHQNNPWLFELIAGIMQPDETPLEVVHRETQEEAGLAILDIVPIYDYFVSPGGTSEKVALFCAKIDASQAGGIHGLAEEGEDIRVHVISATDAFAALTAGEISNAATIIALLWLRLNKEWLQERWQ